MKDSLKSSLLAVGKHLAQPLPPLKECYPASEFFFFILLCVLLDSGRNLHISERPRKKTLFPDVNVETVRKYTANKISILFQYYSHDNASCRFVKINSEF